MSITVVLPTAFTRHTDGRKQFDSSAVSLPALLSEFDTTFPALSTQIKDGHGNCASSSTFTSTTKTFASWVAMRMHFRMATR
jgi:hypothetical protein